MKSLSTKTSLVLFALVIAIGFVLFYIQPSQTNASVAEVDAYPTSTTTQSSPTASTADAPFIGTTKVLKGAHGQLGSVTIASTTIGWIAFYNATTTNITLRGNTPTSTLAVFGSAASAGTYTFDIDSPAGLVMQTSANFNGNFIITYR